MVFYVVYLPVTPLSAVLPPLPDRHLEKILLSCNIDVSSWQGFTMGIPHFLPLVREMCSPINIYKKCRGHTVAIDGMTWLHKYVKIIATQTPFEEESVRNERVLLAIVNVLCRFLNNNILPIFVLDGAPLPGKSETQAQRRSARAQAKIDLDAAMLMWVLVRFCV